MKMRTAVAIFALACFALLAILLLALMRHGEPIYVTQTYMRWDRRNAVCNLGPMGIFFEGKERWKVFTLVAILLILFQR